MPSYKGLCGDASDNLPGVRGIGPKTASALLQQYDTLEGLYAHLDEVRPTVRQKLEHDRDQAFFCERMARLVCLPLKVPLDDLAVPRIRTADVMAFFERMAFQSLLSRFNGIAKTPYGMAHIEGAMMEKVEVKTVKEEVQMTLF